MEQVRLRIFFPATMADIKVAPALSTENEFDKVTVENIAISKSQNEITDSFNLESLCKEILAKDYMIVGLQFPDDLIKYSSQVAEILQQKLENKKVFILADTSYSPCCVDEIAAQHVSADVIVHFGNTCLNRTRSIPVIHVFDAVEGYDLELAAEKFQESFPDKSAKVLIYADSQYSLIADKLYEKLAQIYTNIASSYLKDPQDPLAVFIPGDIFRDGDGDEILAQRGISNLRGELSEYEILYLTSSSPSPSLVLYLSTRVSGITLYDMETSEIKAAAPNLKKRYRYMNIARSATTIGILVNTLSLKDVDAMLRKLQDAIQSASKKHYTFVVGKPNVPKLANFEVVDIWVVLGCSMGGIIVDSDDYYKPIITPYELMLALQYEISWDGQWLIDFESFLKSNSVNSQSDIDEEEVPQVGDDIEDGAPVFDPVTGKYVSTSKPLRIVQHLNIEADNSTEERGLITRMNGQLTIRDTVSTAAEHLHQRSTWSGLGSDHNKDDTEEAAELEQGREGIARGYQVADVQRK